MQALMQTVVGALPPGGASLAQYASPRRFVAGKTGGDLIVKAATALALASVRRTPLEQVIDSLYSKRGDDRLPVLVRAVVQSADTSTPGWAKEVVGSDVQAFLASLPGSAFAALAQRGLVIDLGDNGKVSIPFRAGGLTDLAGAFVGENGAAPVRRTTLGAAELGRYKMVVISAITRELETASGGQAEAIIRTLMGADTSRALDAALLDGAAAVVGVRPAALNAGTPPLPPSAASSRAERIAEDLGAIVDALVAAGCGGPFAFVMNDAQRISMAIACPGAASVDLIASPNVAPGNVFGFDVSQLAFTAAVPEFEVGATVTLVMTDADGVVPTHATNPADRTSVGTAQQVPADGGLSLFDAAQRAAGMVGEGAVAVSMFQQYSLALKTALPISWVKGRAGSCQWIDGVDW